MVPSRELLEDIDVEDGDIVIGNGEKSSMIELSASFKGRLHRPWQHSVIVKLFSRTIGYKVLCTRLRSIWHTSKPFRVIGLENDFFLVQFVEEVDYLCALTEGPYVDNAGQLFDSATLVSIM